MPSIAHNVASFDLFPRVNPNSLARNGLSPNRAEAVRYPDAFVAHIRALAATQDDDEFVALLNRDELKSSSGRRFKVAMIRWIRHKHHIHPSLTNLSTKTTMDR